MTAVSVVLGRVVAGRVLRPLRTMTTRTRRISERNLGEPLALSGPRDELKDLADTVDGLLDRLEAHVAEQRRFAANASHQLRTPLAISRTLLEVARSELPGDSGGAPAAAVDEPPPQRDRPQPARARRRVDENERRRRGCGAHGREHGRAARPGARRHAHRAVSARERPRPRRERGDRRARGPRRGRPRPRDRQKRGRGPRRDAHPDAESRGRTPRRRAASGGAGQPLCSATCSIVRPVLTDSGWVLCGLRRASAPSSRRLMSSHCGFSPARVRCSVQPPVSLSP